MFRTSSSFEHITQRDYFKCMVCRKQEDKISILFPRCTLCWQQSSGGNKILTCCCSSFRLCQTFSFGGGAGTSFAGASFSFGVVGLDDLPSSNTSSSPERVESRRTLADPADGGGATAHRKNNLSPIQISSGA